MEDKNKSDPKAATPPKRGFVPGASGTGGRKKGSKSLTPAQKAEAAALWRSGEITLEGLGKKFGKRPETFSRLFSEMGIKKGEAAAEHQAKVTAQVEARLLNDAEAQAAKIAQMKDDHARMAAGIAKLVWSELVKARAANTPLSALKETMQTLQLAAATLGKTRDELYVLLQVEKFDQTEEDESLPDLTIRELTVDEIDQLRGAQAPSEEIGGDEVVVELDDDDDGGLSA